MRAAIIFLTSFILLAGPDARAAVLCSCCHDGTDASCTAACSAVNVQPGQCIAVLDVSRTTRITTANNPLYRVPLQSVWLKDAGASGLEAFRRLLEKSRKAVEADRVQALAAFRAGTIPSSEAAAAAKRYDDAMVNYYLGVQSYRISRTSAERELTHAK